MNSFFGFLFALFISQALGYDGKIEPNIIGGVEAQLGEFPSMVFLNRVDPQHSKRPSPLALVHSCGATIINSNFILTAAHCCGRRPETYEAVAGVHDINEPNEFWQTRKIANITIHPFFGVPFLHHDVCVIQVDTPWLWTERVQPGNFSEANVTAGSLLLAAGWGLTSNEDDDSYATKLKKLNMTSISREECRKYASAETVDDTALCTFGQEGVTCSGDSGSILALEEVQVGITSWTKGCNSTLPAGFAYIPNLLPWIRSVAG